MSKTNQIEIVEKSSMEIIEIVQKTSGEILDLSNIYLSPSDLKNISDELPLKVTHLKFNHTNLKRGAAVEELSKLVKQHKQITEVNILENLDLTEEDSLKIKNALIRDDVMLNGDELKQEVEGE